MAAFDHNGVPGSALDRELRGLNCTRCDRLSSAHAAALEENAALKAELASVKAHAEAMAATLDTCAELHQCKYHAHDAYRAAHPKE